MRNLLEYTELIVKSIKLLSWPVGSIYTSTKSTDPHKLFGGTWEPIQDTFLWCAGPEHAAGTTGGEETHKLTVEEFPQHTHRVTVFTGGKVMPVNTIPVFSRRMGVAPLCQRETPKYGTFGNRRRIRLGGLTTAYLAQAILPVMHYPPVEISLITTCRPINQFMLGRE